MKNENGHDIIIVIHIVPPFPQFSFTIVSFISFFLPPQTYMDLGRIKNASNQASISQMARLIWNGKHVVVPDAGFRILVALNIWMSRETGTVSGKCAMEKVAASNLLVTDNLD